MNEVGFKSMSDASFNQDSLKKQFNSQFSRIPETNFSNHSGFKVSHVETKEIVHLKKAVNRLERNISYIQHEHSQMLKDLQHQIERLREENQELQFQLVMRAGSAITECDSDIHENVPSMNPHLISHEGSDSSAHQISQLKEALEEEKAKNSELILKLGILTKERTEVKQEMSAIEQNSNRDSENQPKASDVIDISPNIKISLDPLTLSLYHEDSGQYITNTSPTLEDCELIIRTLLDKSQYQLYKTNSASSLRSLSAQRSIVPYLRRPLQNVKPFSRNSAPLKFNSLHGPLSSKPLGLSSIHQKLAPIISHKDDIIKLEDESLRQDSRHTDIRSIGDTKSGYSLPALPKPNDFNQAEKQRRLHLLQRKRLDQYNHKL